MPGPGEAEFDALVGPAEEEFDKLIGAGSDQQQILNATTNPSMLIGHGQEMPVTKIEGGPQSDAKHEAEGRGLYADLKGNWKYNDLGIAPEDLKAGTEHLNALAEGPGQAVKDFLATTAAMAAGAPVGVGGQAALGALQAGTARMADDPNATPQDVATSAGVGGAVGGALGGAGALGQKLIAAGNRGLARLVLSPAEAARLRALGGEARLAETGAKMRAANLDKSRDFLQLLTPTDPKRVAENAFETTATKGPEISRLEDQLLNTNDFGQTEIDTSPLTSELRGYARPNSAEVSTPKIQRALEKQASRFEPAIEEIPVTGSAQMPPPLPNFSKPELPPGYAPPVPVQGELPLPPQAPWQPKPSAPMSQGGLDVAVQPPLPFPPQPGKPPLPLENTTQGSLSFPTNDPAQMSLRYPPEMRAPGYSPQGPEAAGPVAIDQQGVLPFPQTQGNLPLGAAQTKLPFPEPEYQYHATPASNGPAIADIGLRPEQGGKNFAFKKNAGRVYMSPEAEAPMWRQKLEEVSGEPAIQLRTPLSAQSVPGANQAVRVRTEPVPPDRLQYQTPTGAWRPVSDLATPPGGTQIPMDLGTQMELPLEPGGKVTRGEFPAGGVSRPLEATAQVYKPYTAERAIQDKRDIGQQLFDTKQRALKPSFGEDKAREISWRWLADRIGKMFDEGVQAGKLSPEQVAAYKKASQDYHAAAEVQVDSAKRAEQELRRSAGFWRGGLESIRDAKPGTQYNLGRLLEKGPAAAPTAVNALPSSGGGAPSIERATERGLGSPVMSHTERRQAENQANDDLKQKLFQPWYAKLIGNP